MSRPGGTDAGLAGRLLGWVIRLLPDWRQEWGLAMQAELAQLEPGPDRRRFARGCLRASLAQPRVLSALGYPVLVVVALAGIVAWTGRVSYLPLRGALIGLVVVLVAVSWLARHPGWLGPVRGGRIARLVRAGGYGLVGAAALVIIYEVRLDTGNLSAKAGIEIPVCGVFLTLYLAGFITLTARRSATSTQALAIGGSTGVAAAGAWLIQELAWPPLPTSKGGALATLVGAGIAATLLTVAVAGRHRVPAQPERPELAQPERPELAQPERAELAQPERAELAESRAADLPREAILAGLVAVIIAALAIFASADGLLHFFPHWVADTSPANVPAADRLANNIDGDEDQWFYILFLGGLVAAGLTTLARANWRSRSSPDQKAGAEAG